jgi:glycyl-tRNA synthetase
MSDQTPVTATPVESKELTDFADLVSLCKRRGFIFPSSEIYGGIGSCWDYGPLGVELKLNIKESWWKAMTDRDDVEGLDASILMHPRTWEASGHVEGFVDPLVDCKNCKSRFRADKIDPEMLAKNECPNCHKKGTLTEPRLFNLMFKTHMGPLEETSSVVYLRPETAQGIFVNFENVQQSARQKIPFGIAQIGKAFRNEITPGNFIFRTREFEQMEMQYFVKPGTDMEWFETWKQTRINWHLSNGLRRSKLRFHQHGPTELAHYARAAFDVEYEFPIGWQEIEGIHNRSDFDLRRHQEFSNKKLEYFEEATKERYLPFVIETSVGCDRALLAVLCDSYRVEGERTVLKLHPKLAPYKVAVFPLMKKPELLEMTDKIYVDLKKKFRTTYDESGTIGKRYRRQDEIGTPYCVTIDYDGLSNGTQPGTVTVRERDQMTQARIPAENLVAYIEDKMANWKSE